MHRIPSQCPSLPSATSILKGHLLLDLSDRQSRVQALGACSRAVKDGVAPVHAHAVVEGVLALLLLLVSRVGDPSVALQEDGWAEVLLAVPPVAGARGRAARAQDALVQAVQLLAVLLRLEVLLSIGSGSGVLKVWLDGFVLLVEVGQIRNDVLHDVSVREGIDLRLLAGIGGNPACD
jgi:hypothetical protein